MPRMIVNRRLQLQCVIGSPRLCVLFLSLMLLKTGNVLIIWPLAKVKNFVGMSCHIHIHQVVYFVYIIVNAMHDFVSPSTIYLLILSIFLRVFNFQNFISLLMWVIMNSLHANRQAGLSNHWFSPRYLFSVFKLVKLCCWIHQFWY